ncbi:hypothetical protein BT93_E2389 [Corymbia citriodora subsp. variegata]|nr:hypothetical protein BT93_E2389 [Corymbia citriodora subsp. variegata]
MTCLILDGFLLCEILLNSIVNSAEKAVSPSFYIGLVTQQFGNCHMPPQRLRASYVYQKMHIQLLGISFYLSLIVWNSHSFHSYGVLNSAWLSYPPGHASIRK